jgi:plastocyanin
MTTNANITRKMALRLVAAAVMAPLAIERARAADATVKITDFTFNPPALTVNAGTTVMWINEDDEPHTVDATTRVFKSGVLDTDQRFSFTFTTPGAFQYFCALHPHMTGTIVVASGDNTPS